MTDDARSLFRFGLNGGLSFLVNLGLTAGLHELMGAPAELAFAVSLIVVFAMNFLFLRYYIFPGTTLPVGTQLFMFLCSSIGFRGGEYVAFLVLHTFAGAQYLASIVVVLIVSFVAKFAFYRSVVFSRRPSRGVELNGDAADEASAVEGDERLSTGVGVGR